MNYTSIKQSKKLLELGLSPESADMAYFYWKNHKTREEGIDDMPTILGKLPIEKCDIPCWSVGQLLKLMPVIKTDDRKDATPCIVKASETEYYVVFATPDKEVLSSNICATPADACYDMMIFLLEHDYIKI